jgi:hypothetical protein
LTVPTQYANKVALFFTLVDLVHSTPRRIIIERNGKRIAIREDATDADKKNLATKL